MRPYERRQEILAMLRERSEVRVTELTEVFGVSEGTVRSDLDFLAAQDQITRIHGGAASANTHQIGNPAFAARTRVQAPNKLRIARWAADMVNDGDAIFLDNSTTVFHMTSFLHSHRNLTVITCGIETALALAGNPAITVILTGGTVRLDKVTVTGNVGERALDGLHIRTAFLSCAGFSIKAGMTDSDIELAQLKRKVIAASEHVVGLVESSKFGVAHVSSFAGVDEVAQILTDNNLDAKHIEELRETNTVLTICGENTTRSYAPFANRQQNRASHFKVGYAGLSDERPFALEVRRGLEHAAQEIGQIDLVIGDNQYDSEVALRVTDRLISEGVDLAIEYHFDVEAVSMIMDKFSRAGIPVIAVDTPIVGATYFGVDNYRAGWDGGVALGQWINKQWQGRVDKVVVLEHSTGGPLPAARITGQFDGLCSAIGDVAETDVIRLNDGSLDNRTEECMLDVLEAYPKCGRFAVISLSDYTVENVIMAARDLGREEQVICVAQGAGTRFVREELKRPNSRIAAATLFRPERYGADLLVLAERILRGDKVPPAVYIRHEVVDRESLGNYYP